MRLELDIPNSDEPMATIPEQDSPTEKDIEANQVQSDEATPCIPPKVEGSAPDPLPNSATPKKKVTLTKQNGRVTWGTGSEFENRMRKRFGVNRDGFLLAIALLVLLVVYNVIILVMAILWPVSSTNGHVCRDAACFRASSVIIPSLDKNTSPCSDLYQHACGGWSRTYPKPPPTRARWNAQTELQLRLAESVRDVISTLPHPTRVNSVVWKMKHFYDSCMAIDNIETDDKRPLKRIITELGGWNVLREFSILSWDFSQTLVRLHADHAVSPFFEISVVAHPKNSSRSIVEIAPSKLGLPEFQFYAHEDGKMASIYRAYLKDVVQLLGAASPDAKSFSKEIFYFERRIAEALPPTEELKDLRSQQIVNISHLKTIAPSLPIHDILSALFPTADIGENTPLLVKSPKFMTALSSIIATTDRSSLNNYIMWHLTKEYLPYLSQDLQEIHFVYERDTMGVAKPLERWEVCVNALLRFQGPAVVARLQKLVPDKERTARDVLLHEMFENLKWAVKDSVTKADWIDLDVYQNLVKKLDKMQLQTGVGEYYLEDAHLDELYSKLYVQKNDFFQNIHYGITFLKQDAERRYKTPKPAYRWLKKTVQPEISYISSVNILIVPPSATQEPWFNIQYPAALLYGGLGAAISRGIISAVLPPSSFYSANGTLLPINGLVANLSRSSIDFQLSCLNGSSVEQGVESFKAIASVRQALKGLKRATKGKSDRQIAGLEILQDPALAVIRFTQSHCSVQTPQSMVIDEATSAPLSGQAIISLITRNSKSIADAFGCSAPSQACSDLL